MLVSKDKYPNCYEGFQYAEGISKGTINVPNAMKLCVKRFYNDIERSKQPNPPFYTDWDYAERYMRLTQKFKHAKGKWATPNVTYAQWQQFVFLYMLGFKSSKTKRRRFRTCFNMWPRGNGKSCIASQMGLYLLSLDGEVGPEIICASTKKESARIVLDSARVMALKNNEFLKNTGTEVLAHHIVHAPSHGIMKAVASDSSSLDGINGSIIGDEIHEWGRTLYDVLDSSLAKRDDSMFLMITTAGFNVEGIGHELYAYSKKVLEGSVEDDTWFTTIYEMDKEDDWTSQETWKKVNPNWGVSVDPINFAAKAKKAQETPASKNNFLTKHLNVWTNSDAPYFSLDLWDKCADKSLKLEHFLGQKCAMGLDLASKVDLCSKAYIFYKEGKFYVFQKSYLPEMRIDDNRNVQYRRWVDEGYLSTFKGEVNDYEAIQRELIQDNVTFKLIGLNADPWSANETLQKLVKARVPANEFRMTTQNISEPMKKLDALIREGKIVHNGDPLFRWTLGNVVAHEDANANVFCRKQHERLKIDPIVALIMGLALWMVDQQNTSVYETRSLRIL